MNHDLLSTCKPPKTVTIDEEKSDTRPKRQRMPPGFYKESLLFVSMGRRNIDHQTLHDSEDMDRKTSLFGFSIFLNYRQTSVLVSAPGRKSPGQTYGGDLYKCYVRDLQNSCISLLPDDVQDTIGIGTEHVPFLFGSSMLRMNENHIIVRF
ncbi:hypothetical protein RF11_16464 [Thelohanellus kitauei]|uniref:Uncharacterized protein n=1 Tax=Thelohanellus kitauei TaxID=669202 RepID=A0A0C2N447_THEKT|nr:hypothetical protein RF11_16464 [Thelohanellus kitauei]